MSRFMRHPHVTEKAECKIETVGTDEGTDYHIE